MISPYSYRAYLNPTCLNIYEYSNHLNTEHQIHLNTGQYGCLVFKWLSLVTRRTIHMHIFDRKQAFYSPFSNHHLNFGPFDNQTKIYHFNTRPVQYSGGYCSPLQSRNEPAVQNTLSINN